MGKRQPEQCIPLDPAQARLLATVKRLMTVTGMATMLGIAAVLMVIGYRVFAAE